MGNFFHGWRRKTGDVTLAKACDDRVISAGQERLQYAGTLTRMVEHCVRRLLDAEQPVAVSGRGLLGAVVLSISLILVPVFICGPSFDALAEEPVRTAVATPTTDEVGSAGPVQKRRTAAEVFRFRQRFTQELADRLEKRDFEKVIGHFNAELSAELPSEKFKKIWQDLEARQGKIRSFQYRGRLTIGRLELSQINIRLGKTILEMRIDLDDQDRIAGIWIAEAEEDDSPTWVPRGDFYGTRIKQIPSWNKSLEIKVRDFEGNRPEQFRVLFYREVEPDEAAQEDDWTDAVNRERWRKFSDRIRNDADGWTADHLQPGWYRAVANSVSPSGNAFGMSDPIRLEEASRDTQIHLPLQPGGSLRLSLVSDDGQALTNPRVTLTRTDSLWPPLEFEPSRKEGNVFIYEQLPVGEYSISATQRAEQSEGREYELGPGVGQEVTRDEPQAIPLTLKGRPLTEAEKNQREPWIARGRVTDANGHPITGVEIWASAGWGTLFGRVIARTDDEGRYSGRFAQSGMRMDGFDADPLSLISAQVGAYRTGLFEANLNRHGGLHAVNRLPRPDEETPEYVDRTRLFVRGEPREINFVLLPAAKVTVQILDRAGKPLDGNQLNLDGNELPPASSVMASEKIDAAGRFTFQSVPIGYEWWFEVSLEQRRHARSVPLKFSETTKPYEIVLQHTIEEFTGYDRLALISVKCVDDDVKNRIVTNDKPFRPPVPPEIQEQGRQILRQLRTVNRYWLERPPAKVASYSYKFTLPEHEPQSINVADPAAGSISERRGTSYYSALDYLTANPELAIFRAVDIGEQQIELVYALKEFARVSAGNGVSGTWRGYF